MSLPRRTFAAADPAFTMPSVTIADDHGRMSTVVFAQFLQLAEGYGEVRSGEVESSISYDDVASLLAEIGGELAIHSDRHGLHTAVSKLNTAYGPAVVMLTFNPSWEEWDVQVAAGSAAAADAAHEGVLALIPPRPMGGDDASIHVNFWMFNPMMGGGVSQYRKLARTPWSDINGNYPLAVREQLDELVAMTDAPTGGRLMLFHGPPGTGKTRFLQTLAASWSEWCDIHYIVDPDEMFNNALYLHNVMLGDDYHDDGDRWRLVVIEDGDEFIAMDGKQRSGAAVSRLLNVADGFIGQGLKVMVLVSTNVEKIAFNSAIIRSGRCGALIDFPHFPAAEAADWLAAREIEADLGAAETVPLSDLYSFASA